MAPEGPEAVPEAPEAAPDRRRLGLRADCVRCFGLCCVGPGFSASADFAIDKAPGAPCPNLRPDFRCRIHDRLRQRGFPGCTAYDCFGAGQKVAQGTFGGQDWRSTPELRTPMLRAFEVMHTLHELLWYLAEALTLGPAGEVHGELRRAFDETRRVTDEGPDALMALDVDAHRRQVIPLLRDTSELIRATVPGRRRDLSNADLAGRTFRGGDLHGASLRGTCLIAADLRGADLSGADLIGTDLRGADLSGADLGGSVFLTQFQVNAADGDAGTRLPPALSRPAHWPAPPTPVHC